jgi:CheY-like chemotaxis protein
MTGSRRPILIVEDDVDLVACLRAVLEGDRRSVIAVGEGAAALAACEQVPLLALVDLHIPGELSGAELVAALRARLPGHAPIILLSAERDLALRARELGADGGLEKPFDIDDLLRIVREAADRAGEHAPSQHP